jgi:hypothetical protein
MHRDAEDHMMQFHERARPLFFSQYRAFRKMTAGLNRQGDENRFQQLKNQYSDDLHLQLQAVALSILGGRGQAEPPSAHLQMGLTQAMKDYLKEFRQKIDLL